MFAVRTNKLLTEYRIFFRCTDDTPIPFAGRKQSDSSIVVLMIKVIFSAEIHRMHPLPPQKRGD